MRHGLRPGRARGRGEPAERAPRQSKPRARGTGARAGAGRARPAAEARGAGADAGTSGACADALVLGAIVPWKRPDLALEIAALAARELPELRLRIAGEPLDAHGEALLARLRERAGRPDLAGRV